MRVDDPARDRAGADARDIADVDVIERKITDIEVEGVRCQPLTTLDELRRAQRLSLPVNEAPRSPAHFAVWSRSASSAGREWDVHGVRLQHLTPSRACQFQRQP